MTTIRVNSLTHHGIASDREQYVVEAVGRELMFVGAPCEMDSYCVGVYDGLTRIGNVMADETLVTQRLLLASDDDSVRGRVREVLCDGYVLAVEVPSLKMASEEDVRALAPCGLEGWTSSVATMGEWDELQRAVAMAKMSAGWLRYGGAVDTACEVVGGLCEVLCHDLSGEMRTQRKVLVDVLTGSGEARLREAGERLLEKCQRMGGDHVMSAMGHWLKTELPRREVPVRMMMAETRYGVTVEQVEAEVRALPRGLYDLWQRDVARFASVLYGMRLPRTEVRRVLSPLVWLEVKRQGVTKAEETESGKDTPAQVKDKGSDLVCEDLLPIFLNDDEAAAQFMKAVAKMEPVAMTDYVNRLVASGRIAKRFRHRRLWRVLNDCGLYALSESTWNRYVK